MRSEPQEREQLQKLVATGGAAARKLTHGRILLQADASQVGPRWTDEQVAAALERGKREQSAAPRILDGRKEAKLVAICCSEPPMGRTRWTLKLPADRIVELEIVESKSRNTVRRTAKSF